MGHLWNSMPNKQALKSLLDSSTACVTSSDLGIVTIARFNPEVTKTFLAQHPDLKINIYSAHRRSVDEKLTLEAINDWFNKFIHIVRKYNAKLGNTYNRDETRFQVGSAERARFSLPPHHRLKYFFPHTQNPEPKFSSPQL